MDLFARILNFTLMIAMPFGLAIYLLRRYKTSWSLFGIGVVTFVLSQVGHIPFNHFVLDPLVEGWGLDLQVVAELVLFGLLYGLSAGLFEEVMRFLGYKLWIKQDRNWKSALMFGAGHGGIESILLGGIVLYGFIQAMVLTDVDLLTVVEPEQVEAVRAQLAAYWAVPWHLAILGAVERLSTIIFHLSASILVLQSFSRRNIRWLFLAVAWHTLVNAIAVFASQTWNPYVTEAIILLMGFISLGIILILKPSQDQDQAVEEMEVKLTSKDQVDAEPIPPSEESLEDSRFI